MFDQAAADDEVKRLREECGLLGALLLTLAVEWAGASVRKTLAELTADAVREAWDRASGAAALARWCAAEVDALKQRVRELERNRDRGA